MVQTSLLELVGRGDSDSAGDSATRQSVTGYHCDVQNVMTCNRSLKQTAISLSSCEAEFYADSACAGELLGLAELFKELHYDVAGRPEMDSDSARHILQSRGPGGTRAHRDTMLGNTAMDRISTSFCKLSGHAEHSRSLHETSGWIANTVTCEEAWASNPGWYRWYERNE